MKRTIALILALVMTVCLLSSCSISKIKATPIIDDPTYFDMSAYDTTKPIKFEILMESGDRMEGELYYDIAPITVANFVTLANKDFYNGLTFHYIYENEFIQGGCPFGDGTSGKNNTEYTIRGEFSNNDWTNKLKHTQGVISMARYTDNNNSAYSQFFIMNDAFSDLNGDYAAFGKITKGYKIITALTNLETAEDGTPINPPVIAEINILGN